MPLGPTARLTFNGLCSKGAPGQAESAGSYSPGDVANIQREYQNADVDLTVCSGNSVFIWNFFSRENETLCEISQIKSTAETPNLYQTSEEAVHFAGYLVTFSTYSRSRPNSLMINLKSGNIQKRDKSREEEEEEQRLDAS